MIPLPHGGHLIDRRLSPGTAARRREEIDDLPSLRVETEQALDAGQIGTGAYSPLTGFMDREVLTSVLEHRRLPDGLPWTLPILLTPPGDANRRGIDRLRIGEEVLLRGPRDEPVALLHLRERFAVPRTEIARQVYGTTDPTHPNISDLLRSGDVALAGPLETWPAEPGARSPYELTPLEARQEFQRRGWSSVVGYQTRNVPHRAHEYLQRMALEREDVDGLFIHPVIGRLRPGDYRAEIVVRAYEQLLANYLPPDRALLATLAIGMRYAGPRAAAFLAIVRKNFGCSHYIVGRDQAGIGDVYAPYASQLIFDELPVGVVPLRFPEAFFCRRCDGISTSKTCPHPASEHESASQTRIRTAIREGQPLPRGLLRPEIAQMLLREGELALHLPPPPTVTVRPRAVPAGMGAAPVPAPPGPP